MAGEKFNLKSFNPQAFGHYVERVPNLKRNELINSKVLRKNSEISSAFASQSGTGYGTIPLYGLIGGTPDLYDGKTDITTTTTNTFEQSVIVIGRSKAWTEQDFAEDITGGVSFMSNVGNQVAKYWDGVDQDTLLAILKGIFSMTGTGNEDFVNNHTYDISLEDGENAKVGATTLNSAIQQACGDNKSAFAVAIMHSAVATNLENINALNYLKYTDQNGIQRDLGLATWNGRLVLIDDSLPTETSSGNTVYTSYILGEGAFFHENLPVKTPYETHRDPFVNGGQDTLITRQRKCFAPYGISYTKTNQASLTPTDTELADGNNWELVNSGGSDIEYINHRAIPIAQIISLG